MAFVEATPGMAAYHLQLVSEMPVLGTVALVLDCEDERRHTLDDVDHTNPSAEEIRAENLEWARQQGLIDKAGKLILLAS